MRSWTLILVVSPNGSTYPKPTNGSKIPFVVSDVIDRRALLVGQGVTFVIRRVQDKAVRQKYFTGLWYAPRRLRQPPPCPPELAHCLARATRKL
jgi:hypothetical protein